MRTITHATLLAVAFALTFPPGAAAAAESPARTPGAVTSADLAALCAALQDGEYATLADAPTHVTSSRAVPAEGRVPAFCRVQGYVAPNTGIELRLPLDAWNGKFFHAGCTGSCGFAIDSPWTKECDYPLTRGYACIVSDMGHRSGSSDGLWASRGTRSPPSLPGCATPLGMPHRARTAATAACPGRSGSGIVRAR